MWVHPGVLATKEDIAELKTDIAKFQATTKEDIAGLGADNSLLHWMVGFNLVLTSAGVIALIIK